MKRTEGGGAGLEGDTGIPLATEVFRGHTVVSEQER